jgi:hypothetical protein
MPRYEPPHLLRCPFDEAKNGKTAREHSHSLVVACDVCDGHKASRILTVVGLFAFSRSLARRRPSRVGGCQNTTGWPQVTLKMQRLQKNLHKHIIIHRPMTEMRHSNMWTTYCTAAHSDCLLWLYIELENLLLCNVRETVRVWVLRAVTKKDFIFWNVVPGSGVECWRFSQWWLWGVEFMSCNSV